MPAGALLAWEYSPDMSTGMRRAANSTACRKLGAQYGQLLYERETSKLLTTRLYSVPQMKGL